MKNRTIYKDERGVHRFKSNAVVQYLLDNGGLDMNDIAKEVQKNGIPHEDMAEFCQMIGYSVSGWGDLSWPTSAQIRAADRLSEKLTEPGE